jgi:hypothetical protein
LSVAPVPLSKVIAVGTGLLVIWWTIALRTSGGGTSWAL